MLEDFDVQTVGGPLLEEEHLFPCGHADLIRIYEPHNLPTRLAKIKASPCTCCSEISRLVSDLVCKQTTFTEQFLVKHFDAIWPDWRERARSSTRLEPIGKANAIKFGSKLEELIAMELTSPINREEVVAPRPSQIEIPEAIVPM
jgi:hypothetical protein